MSEVLSFTGKYLPLKRLIEDHVQKIKDIIPERLCEVFLNMDSKGLRDTLHQALFNNLAWGIFRDENESVVGVSFNSVVRPALIPEFGLSKENDFLSFYWRDCNSNADISKIPNIQIEDVHESLTQYYVGKFPEVSLSNRIAFSYAILSSICLNDRFKITEYGFDKKMDCYVIDFIETTEDNKVCRQYWMRCEFLPILLDSIALEWWDKNNSQ